MLADGYAIDFPAQGTSMRPLFAPGTTLRVYPATANDVRPGDIVLVAAGERLMAHRLIRVEGERIVTRGDAMPGEDEPLPREAIIGRVAVPAGPRALYAAVRALLRC
jgi:phage repressor protein C with HTH and peptisase S24 domain